MDVERAVISRIVHTGQIEIAMSRGFLPEHFKSDQCESVWAWLTEYTRKFRTPPSFDMVRQHFPEFKFLVVTDALEPILDEFERLVKRRALISKIRFLSDLADGIHGDVRDAELHMMSAARDLASVVPSRAVTRFSDSLGRLDLYKERLKTGLLPGVSFTFPELDNLTYGIQRYEMAVIQGFLGLGKSTLAIRMCFNAYMEHDQTPLFMSLEMEGEKLANKWDALAAQVSYNAMKRLELGEGDLEKWEKIGEKAANARLEKDILVIDDLYRCTIDDIHTSVVRWKPDIMVVDTLNEVQAPSSYRSRFEQVGYVARELKGIARSTKHPILAIAQGNRDSEEQGARLGNVAEGIDIPRKADIVIGMHSDEKMQRQKKMELRVLKNRDGEGQKRFEFYWDVASMEFRRWRESDSVGQARERVPAA